MLRMYSFRMAKRAINTEAAFIQRLAAKYDMPESWIRAILLKEMTEIDLLDIMADIMVNLWHGYYRVTGKEPCFRGSFFGKRDSSTGWSQIFGYVAINAINRAVDRGLTDYATLGIETDHRLRGENPEDLWLVWHRLNRDRHFNIEMCALNLLSCAEEMNGHTDIMNFSEEETRRTFTRYNADVRNVTHYGELVHHFHQEYQKQNL